MQLTRGPIRFFIRFTIALFLLVAFAPRIVVAESENARSVLFRVSTGPSYASFFDNYLEGPAGDISVAIGTFVSRTVAVQLMVAGSATISTTHEGASTNRDAYFYGGGLGATYYSFSNVYGSLSLMAGSQRRSSSNNTLSVWASELLIGKEWGKGKVGYGVALGFLAELSSEGSHDRQLSGSGSLRFSLTVR
jgi:hypothetical protein